MITRRIAQYGTKHGHAAGKLDSLRRNPAVEFAGVFEPDARQRTLLERAGGVYAGVHWFADENELLGDPSIVAVASEGRNDESLAQTEAIIEAGKHVWYDKPAGENWAQWQRVVATAQQKQLHIQMGYMFRYHAGFRLIGEWVCSGMLGPIFALRAHMSTWIDESARAIIARHSGGIFYDLAGHMLDQICWLLGRPDEVSSFFQNASGVVPAFQDNTLAVLRYAEALVSVDIAAMETPPMARRFEVYGAHGSAIMEPFEPATHIRLCLDATHEGFVRGVQHIPVATQTRQELYDRELEAFLEVIQGKRTPDRSPEHDLLVQETLLRAVGHTSKH